MRFFSTLYTVLKRGARAALQFYPENTAQVILITECATRVGFQGGKATHPSTHPSIHSPIHPSLLHPPKVLCTSSPHPPTPPTHPPTHFPGLVVDYPNSSKAKKYYLCLSFEHSYRVPRALGGEGGGGGGERGVGVTERERGRKKREKGGGKRKGVKSRDWVLAKKEQQRRRGLDVREDSKYTARKRKDKL